MTDCECAICLESIQNPCNTNCNHKFHYTCLFKWIESNKTSCPLCRAKLEGPDISYIKAQTLATKDIAILGSSFLEKLFPTVFKGFSDTTSTFMKNNSARIAEMYAKNADSWGNTA